jgi:hypothetical protein
MLLLLSLVAIIIPSIIFGSDSKNDPSITDLNDIVTLQSLLDAIIDKMREPIKVNDIPNSSQSNMPQRTHQILLSSKDSELILQDESFWNAISLLFHSRIKSLSKNLINVTNTTHGQLKEISNNLNPLITEIDKKHSSSQTVSNHHSSTGIVMNQQIKKRTEDDHQFEKIFNGLYDHLPNPLIGIIGDYNQYHYDKTIIEFLRRIIHDLGVSEEERNSLDLYSSSFAFWLLERVKEKKEEFPPRHQLWYHDSRYMAYTGITYLSGPLISIEIEISKVH